MISCEVEKNAVIRNHERNETRLAGDVFSNERADVGEVIRDSGAHNSVRIG